MEGLIEEPFAVGAGRTGGAMVLRFITAGGASGSEALTPVMGAFTCFLIEAAAARDCTGSILSVLLTASSSAAAVATFAVRDF